MSEDGQLLSAIEDGLNVHGGELGGWTKLSDEACQIFDGRVTIRAEVSPTEGTMEGVVHAHVFATLHEHDDEVLDACLMGMGEDRSQGIKECAFIWITNVAGPIRSFMDNVPVCMTCQAGVIDGDRAKGYSPGDYGLNGLRAYVGPAVVRAINDNAKIQLDDTTPWFQFAAESAAPRRVHLAKATVNARGAEGWDRQLEIDGHDVSHKDPDWLPGVTAPEMGYMTRFAVFEFPRNSNVISHRAELDRTIRHFISNFSKFESVDELQEQMVVEGFDPDVVKEVESISTIGFGRVFFESYGVKYSPIVFRARRDGTVEENVPLMSIPAFSRGKSILMQMAESLTDDEWQAICFYNAESNAILQTLDAVGKEMDFSSIRLFPCVVPDRDVPQATMDLALSKLNALIKQSDRQREAKRKSDAKKPWWKFW